MKGDVALDPIWISMRTNARCLLPYGSIRPEDVARTEKRIKQLLRRLGHRKKKLSRKGD